jgi:hypothetical protein
MSENERSYRWQAPVETAPEEEGFLGRWSRRKKLAREAVLDQEAPQVAPVQAASEEAAAIAVPADLPHQREEPPESAVDELTDADMPPIDTLTEFSDLSMFMSKNVSAALRMKALTRVFHSSRYNQICLCAEYAEDYNQYTALGSIVPHDLKSAIAREAESLRERLLARGEKISVEDAQARIVAEREAGVTYSDLGPAAGVAADPAEQEEGRPRPDDSA